MKKHGREFWEIASEKSRITHKTSISKVKARLKLLGWECCTFQTKSKGPVTGIVDLVAIRRKHPKINPDKLQIVLYQAKGGSARFPDKEARTRLQRAARSLEIGYNYVTYKPSRPIEFHWGPDEFLDWRVKPRASR